MSQPDTTLLHSPLLPPTASGFRWSVDETGAGQAWSGKRPNWWQPYALFFFDLAAALACFFLMKRVWVSEPLPAVPASLVIFSVLAASAWVGGFRRTVDFLSLRFTVEYLLALTLTALLAFFIVILAFTYGTGIQASRGWLITWPFLFFAVSLGFKRCMTNYRFQHYGLPVAILIGTEAEAETLQKELVHHGQRTLVTVVSPEKLGDAVEQGFTATFQLPGVEAIVLSPEIKYPRGSLTHLLTTHVSHVPVLTWEAFFEHYLKKVSLEILQPTWLFDVDFPLAPRSHYDPVKRIADIIMVLVALPLILPVMLLIGALIRFDSHGPVLFCQQRVGRFCQPFRVVKFRTMHDGSAGGTTQAGDKRITTIGHFLRKYRLDELPQLWNILLGQMSFIGPRPEWNACVEDYEKEIPFYHLRHAVRPGLTGWAQVNYSYGENVEDAREKFAYDLYYLRHFSATLDVAICLKTVFVVLFGRGGR